MRFTSIVVFILTLYATLVPVQSLAIDFGFGADNTAGRAANAAGYDLTTDEFTFARIAGVAIQAVSAFLGIVFTVLIVFAGYSWMTARGDDAKVEKAQGTIQTAIIGLVIVLSAYAISNFVLTYFLG